MFWRSLPGLKRIVRPGGIFTSLPVRGLRPMPRLRGFTWKTPKPRSSIRSPFIKESFIASRTASTATSALTFVMSAALDTSLMMSTLIMGMDLLLSDSYYRVRPFGLSIRGALLIPIPRIALVGRPNVGKSTLFNRICGRRKAITDRRPGSTRDRNYAEASWQGAAFELIDTGGLLLQTDDPLLGPAAAQAQLAIDEADLVLFVVDGRAGLLPDDQAIAARLRRGGKKVIVVVNKIEGPEDGTEDFARLGFSRMLAVSAEHGQGVGDLLDLALGELPRVAIVEDAAAPLRVAIVGRPNVGKSSLLNRLLGSERSVVSAIPGTTRDSVDSVLERAGKRYHFFDTAGIRRQRLLKETVDQVSVVQARRSIERADVAILLLDATEGVREMDATIAGYIHKAGRGVVIAVNKWD